MSIRFRVAQVLLLIFSGVLARVKRTPAEHHGYVNIPIPRDRTPTERTTVCPHHRKTNVYSHFLASLGAQEKTDCTSMLWSIDSCQNRATADQYHLAISRARVSPIDVEYFLKLSADKLLVFKGLQAQVYFFQKFIWNMLCLCHYGPALLRFWFQTSRRRENSASFYKNTSRKDLLLQWSRIGQALRPIYMLWLVKIWKKKYAVSWNLFPLTAEAGSVWCDFFNCLFPLDVQNEKQPLSRVHCYSWLVCLMGFWLRNASLVEVGNPISDGIVFVFHLAWCVRGLQSLKRYWPYLIPFRSCISNGKPE